MHIPPLPLLLPLLLSASTSATPLPSALTTFHTTISTPLSRRTQPTALSILLHISPSSLSCPPPSSSPECSTAAHAAPYLITAMSTYNLTSPGTIAALLALIAYETGDLVYNTNHFPAPGRPGQGTRNMQMAAYNLLYARSIAELAGPLADITTAESVLGLSDDELNAIRALVLPDEYAWASAAWFLTSQCGEDVQTGLEGGSVEGWEAYLGCVGTEATEDREAYWVRAKEGFGIA